MALTLPRLSMPSILRPQILLLFILVLVPIIVSVSFCFVYVHQRLLRFDDALGLRTTTADNDTHSMSTVESTHSMSTVESTHFMSTVESTTPAIDGIRLNETETCIRRFLRWYDVYCDAHVRPKYHPLNATNSTLLCPCIPNTLVGLTPITKTVPLVMDEMNTTQSGVRGRLAQEMGRWRPLWCVARQRVAIIIPYADRETHLPIFLSHMHPLLQRQLIDYSIFVIEQLSPHLFNRAALMNVGFLEAMNWAKTVNEDDEDEEKRRPFDCYIFHDVDQLPIDDRNFYVCSQCPRHVVVYRKKFNYSLSYPTWFGGGNSFTEEEFVRINGFSNNFYGWGGEDDDLYQRTVAMNMSRMRYPRCIAKYDEVMHKRDKRNPRGLNQRLGFAFRPKVYRNDGLSNINYSVEATKTTRLMTKVSVHLPPPPPNPPPSKARHRSGSHATLKQTTQTHSEWYPKRQEDDESTPRSTPFSRQIS